MKPQISLKWFLVLTFLSVGIILVIGYSMLSAHFFVLGMDNILASNMDAAARSFLAEVPSHRHKELNSFSGYFISRNWSQMPGEIRRGFDRPPGKPGVLHKYDPSGWLQPPETIYFVMRCVHHGKTLFVASSTSRKNSSPLVGRNANQNLNTLIAISAVIALMLVVIIKLLFKRVSKPVTALGNWARTLNQENLGEKPPNFSYPELNELAMLIRASLLSVQESLEREHRFLRHASHELRTPISIILNNIELLNKVRKTNQLTFKKPYSQIINRIDRASLTMKHLTETLLWLSREQTESLPKGPVDLDQLIRQLVEENRYLLKDKAVDVELNTTPFVLQLPQVAVRIVLSNLLRNAFQHTFRGRVVINQEKSRVTVINDSSESEDPDKDLGFGLGLKLTAQLTARLNWTYVNESEENYHRAEVVLKEKIIKE